MAQEPKTVPDKRRLNPTLIGLLGGVAVLLLLVVFFAINRNPEQDKLSDEQINQVQAEANGPEKLCSSKAAYEAIKRELFRRAAQVRGSDQATFDSVAAYAVVRMENPVMESEDSATGAANCSASLSLDLPPGVAVAGGRRNLTADIDYRVDPGGSVALGDADAIVTALSTLARVEEAPAPADENAVAPEENVAASESAAVQPGPPTSYPGRPSFDCSKARTRGEIAVCSDSGLSALDLNMTTQYRRALGTATPQQLGQLQATRNRFIAYRDGCPTRQCIADAYVGRMREIRDIMEGRLQPSR